MEDTSLENQTKKESPGKMPGGTPLKKKIIGIVLLILIMAVISVLTYYLCAPILRISKDPDAIRAYFDEQGAYGVAAFMGAMILQVIGAIIPAGPFEVASGYAFGAVKGTIICDISTTIGSFIVFAFVRRFGMRFIELFISREKIESLKFLKINDKREKILFVLFLIPGTPKDLITYAVGLTDIKVGTWLLITAIGRLPSIALSAYSGAKAGNEEYGMFIIVMVILMLLFIAGSAAYKLWSSKADKRSRGHKKDSQESDG